GQRRERIGDNRHLVVKGSRKEKVDGTRSLVTASLQVKVDKSHGLEAGEEIHVAAGSKGVGEGQDGITLKSGSNFISIDAVGVTIFGQVVKINAGGSAGSGSSVSAGAPEDPQEATVAEPAPPAPPPAPPPELPRPRPVKEKTWIRVL